MADEKVPQHPASEGTPADTFERAAASDQRLQQLHDQLMREKSEPTERFAPTPLALVILIAALSFWAGIYLIDLSADFDMMVYNETLAGGKNAAAAEPVEFDPYAAGQRFYTRNCVACHQSDGAGQGSAFPPLANSDWVQGPEEKLIKILLYGMNGPIVVNGQPYNGAMPAFLQTSRKPDRDIAAVLTYIRTNPDWGNNAEPVSEEAVRAVREELGNRGPMDGPTLQAEYGPNPSS